MTLIPRITERFGGLDFFHEPGESGIQSAVDMLNADVDLDGRLRTRDGLKEFSGSGVTAGRRYRSIWSTGQNYLLLGYTSGAGAGAIIGLDTIDDSGAITALATSIPTPGSNGSQSITDVVQIGTTTGPRLYITAAGVAETVLGYTTGPGSAFVSAAANGKPGFIAVSPRSNRLVQGYYSAAANTPSGANGSESTVFFSNANDPDTWAATNFVHLRPGDGERIVGMITWRDLLIVFKQTHMFVFFGETPDDDGLPIFNYREVSLPAPLTSSNNVASVFANRVVAGGEAVYLSTSRGIYATTGGESKSITDPVNLLYGTENDPYAPLPTLFKGGGPNIVAPRLHYVGGKLIMPYQTAAGPSYWLVWDEHTRNFRVWQLDPVFSYTPQYLANFMSDRITSNTSADAYQPSIFFPSNGTDGKVFVMNREEDDDNGTAIPWFYTTGYTDLGYPGEKHLRFTDIYGSGTVTSQYITRGERTGATTDPGSAVTLGTFPAIARKRRYGGAMGRQIGHKLSGTGRAQITRLEYRYAKGRMT